MNVSLSNQVCDNLRIDETSVHTIYCPYNYGEAQLSILSPRSQFGSKRVSNSKIPQSHFPLMEESLANIMNKFLFCNKKDKNIIIFLFLLALARILP